MLVYSEKVATDTRSTGRNRIGVDTQPRKAGKTTGKRYARTGSPYWTVGNRNLLTEKAYKVAARETYEKEGLRGWEQGEHHRRMRGTKLPRRDVGGRWQPAKEPAEAETVRKR